MTEPIAIIGGGITGLVAARALAQTAPAAPIVLFESEDRLGGKIRTHGFDGAVIEGGPDWFIANNDVAPSLCRELGLEDDLVTPSMGGALIWSRAGLRPLPRGFVRGVPASVGSLLRCGHLSAHGRMRALGDLFISGPLRGPDVSVGELVRRRFGVELLERLVDPILAASRSGSPDDMSLAAATPELDAAARSRRSVTLGLRASAGPPPSFRGLSSGMERLVDALARDLRGTDIRLRSRLEAVEERAEGGFRLRMDGGEMETRALLLALPPPAAARALRGLDEELAFNLQGIRYTAAAVVSFIYPPGTVAPPSGASGFLVPVDEGRLLTACSWYSAKWRDAVPADGSFVMRCFAGRTPDDPVLGLSDDELEARLAHEVAFATGIPSTPKRAFVDRWKEALPLYEVGHLDRVARIEAALTRHPGLDVAGAGYRGSGLPDCIAAGRAAAHRIHETLG